MLGPAHGDDREGVMTDATTTTEKHDTKFKPGHRPQVRRAKGSQNKITRDIKKGIIEAAVRIGSDGKGKGGLVGYLTWLARKKPAAFAQLLGKLVPINVTGDIDVTGGVTVNIVSVPNDHYVKGSRPEHQPPVIEPLPVIEEPAPVVEEPPAAALPFERGNVRVFSKRVNK